MEIEQKKEDMKKKEGLLEPLPASERKPIFTNLPANYYELSEDEQDKLLDLLAKKILD